ncbi:phage tail assembly chaperone [Acinetobacter stercoris]|uniref:Phage tail protein n=1 Tax=Acinetobacter stercoris TaxID=2126983 RepID=A0A2U3MZP1_9GAMM|nr:MULTISPECIES: hypothetical protein [Acinetobacter]SPL70864.1 hypothetical protein KPC_2042 [Acinetobacter stercoris]
MARKVKDIEIQSGRDQGKKFRITEMPVLQADRWAMRAIFALTKAGVNIQGVDPKAGMLEMAKVASSALSGLDTEEGIGLLDELLECVKIIPGGGEPREPEWDDDLEDFKSLFILRKEALMLHLDFLAAGSSPDSND